MMKKTKAGIFLFNIIPAYRPGISKVFDFGYYKLACVPSLGQRVKQNTLYTSLEDAAGENLSDLDLLYIFATENEEFAKINWKDPGTFNCVEINAPTFTDNEGFNGNGSDSGLDTTWVPSTDAVNFQLNNASCFHHTNTDLEDNGALEYGAQHTSNAAARILIQVRSTLDTIASIALNSGVGIGGSNTNGIGFYLNTRDGSGTTNHDIYKDGVLNDGTNAASGGLPDQSIYLCGFHNNAGAFSNGSESKISLFGAGGSLLASQSALYTAWNTYFSSL